MTDVEPKEKAGCQEKAAGKEYIAKRQKKYVSKHTTTPIGDSKPEKFPHFRYYRKSGHPALITAEYSEKEYKYRKVMHGDRDGRNGRTNEKVFPNPDPNETEPMYIAKRVRHDKKNAFEPFILPWKYPSKKKK